MAFRSREPVDLYAVTGTTLIFLFVLTLAPDSWLRLVLGLPVVLYFPGHALVSALFPGRSLAWLERVALGFGLSLAVVPLLGLGLNFTPWGIRLVPVVVTVAGATLALAAVGLVRRHRLPPLARPEFVVDVALPKWGGLAPLDRVLAIGLGVSVLVAGAAVAYAVTVDRPGEAFTEFYMLGPDGKVGDYPSSLAPGEQVTVILGIVDHEGRAAAYEIKPRLVENATGEVQVRPSVSVTLEDGAKWETPYEVEIPGDGLWRVVFDLHMDGAPTAHRSLHLWVRSEGGSA